MNTHTTEQKVSIAERRLAMLPPLEEEVSIADSGHRALVPVFVAVVEAAVLVGAFVAPRSK